MESLEIDSPSRGRKPWCEDKDDPQYAMSLEIDSPSRGRKRTTTTVAGAFKLVKGLEIDSPSRGRKRGPVKTVNKTQGLEIDSPSRGRKLSSIYS